MYASPTHTATINNDTATASVNFNPFATCITTYKYGSSTTATTSIIFISATICDTNGSTVNTTANPVTSYGTNANSRLKTKIIYQLW